MRVLFLDIDGVLNSMLTNVERRLLTIEEHELVDETLPEIDRKLGGWALKTLDPVLISRLCTLLEACDIQNVVISSNWKDSFPLAFIDGALRLHGFDAKIIGKTPDRTDEQRLSDDVVSRGKLIKEWLKNNSDVTEMLIIDDRTDMDDLPGFVHINGNTGLTEYDIESAKTRVAPIPSFTKKKRK